MSFSSFTLFFFLNTPFEYQKGSLENTLRRKILSRLKVVGTGGQPGPKWQKKVSSAFSQPDYFLFLRGGDLGVYYSRFDAT